MAAFLLDIPVHNNPVAEDMRPTLRNYCANFASACFVTLRCEPSGHGDQMKDEYDFSKGERGKFCRPGAVLNPPVHLDAEVRAFLTPRAQARGMSLSDL